ncbi:MAG: hypothetical protein AVDCRST_MAG71-2345 [uncultured Lysobacter sp.]|uniref:Uncharacterized protein n=1 Tax=uncultured Lysobacter sp. TaxID=271060 RepID=A0A6J4LV58_9GAMM|nr:MAG: hypothetical protein AVDCRST_MAG71-2345 [uncultured Lysobacter sp.]
MLRAGHAVNRVVPASAMAFVVMAGDTRRIVRPVRALQVRVDRSAFPHCSRNARHVLRALALAWSVTAAG